MKTTNQLGQKNQKQYASKGVNQFGFGYQLEM